MTRAEARDELAHRWHAPTLEHAANAEAERVRTPPPLRPEDLLNAVETYGGKRRAGQRNWRTNNGGKAA